MVSNAMYRDRILNMAICCSSLTRHRHACIMRKGASFTSWNRHLFCIVQCTPWYMTAVSWGCYKMVPQETDAWSISDTYGLLLDNLWHYKLQEVMLIRIIIRRGYPIINHNQSSCWCNGSTKLHCSQNKRAKN